MVISHSKSITMLIIVTDDREFCLIGVDVNPGLNFPQVKLNVFQNFSATAILSAFIFAIISSIIDDSGFSTTECNLIKYYNSKQKLNQVLRFMLKTYKNSYLDRLPFLEKTKRSNLIDTNYSLDAKIRSKCICHEHWSGNGTIAKNRQKACKIWSTHNNSWIVSSVNVKSIINQNWLVITLYYIVFLLTWTEFKLLNFWWFQPLAHSFRCENLAIMWFFQISGYKN